MRYYFLFGLILLGLFLIIGTIFNLQSLVDPPTDWSQSSSFAFIKKYFGKKVLIVSNYVFGVISIIAGIILYKYF